MNGRRSTMIFRSALLSVAAIFVLAACTSSDDGGETGTANEPAAGASAEETTGEMETTEPTIAELVAANGDFSTLLTAVTEAELAETLGTEGPFTVFAPTDDAFAQLPEGTLDSLLEPRNQDQLAGILTYHVVPGEVMAADVMPGEVQTVNGETFTVSMDGENVVLTDAAGNEVTVVQTDIPASNGVVHVIDGVLLP